MSGFLRHTAAWFVLQLLPGLGSPGHAGMMHPHWSGLPAPLDENDFDFAPASDSLDKATELEIPVDEHPPLTPHLLLPRSCCLPDPDGCWSACPSSPSASVGVISFSAGCEPTPPGVAARLVVRQTLFIPDPTLSSLFRPPRSA